MKGLWWLLLVCALVAGIFLGIQIERSAHKHRDFTYVVTNYREANLKVSAGDRISIVDNSGKPDRDLVMDFMGNSACEKNQNNVNSCVLKSPLGIGSYYFICQTSPNGPDLCDPGIQQQPSTGTEGIKPTALPDNGALIRAIVYCNEGTTALRPLNGADPSKLSTNDTLVWTSSDPFTLSTSMAAFCTKDPTAGPPGVPEDSCTASGNAKQMDYKLTAQSCGPMQFTVNLK